MKLLTFLFLNMHVIRMSKHLLIDGEKQKVTYAQCLASECLCVASQ